MFKIKPNCEEAYKLLHEGSLALMDIEENGIRVDVDYCRKQDHRLKRKAEYLERKIHRYPEMKNWQRSNPRKKFNVHSGPQLGEALFKYSNHKPLKETATGKASTDEESLSSLDIPLVKDILEIRKIQKVRSTYLGGFIREQVDGILHPFFNLELVRTFRSSCDSPNFQNIPVRVPWIKKICRQAIIPSPGNMLMEIDYCKAEVCAATCYHKDPNMIAEIEDPSRDMHRDMAMECYLLGPDQWTGDSRYAAKNKYVFPEFYGSYYANCAKDLWEAITSLKLKTREGVPLKSHLKKKGIKSYKRFEKHIKAVEKRFWNEKFGVYGQWKKDHVKEYIRTGKVNLLTGFSCTGIMDDKEAINYPVQGIAFHWLLWSVIQLNKYLKEHNFKSKIIGQIHDSIVMDIYPPELMKVTRIAERIMTVLIRKHWPWIIIPLGVEFEVSPVNGSWYLKKEVIKKYGPCPDCKNVWRYEIKKEKHIWAVCPICSSRMMIQ